MKQFTVSIHEDKTKLFLDILNELAFVEDIQDVSAISIAEDQKNIVRERIAMYSKDKYRDWNELDIDVDKQ